MGFSVSNYLLTIRVVGEQVGLSDAQKGIVGVAAALGAMAAASVKVAGDFEAGMNRFASVAGSSLAQAGFSLDDVKDKALQLGATTQFSAAQAQEAMINLAKGGVPVVDIMGQATQATLDLAAAGELELASAADIVAKQLGVWASEGVTATEVSNLMAQAANASTVGVEDLAMGMAAAGGVAKVTGVSFKDTVQTIALLAPGFSSASDAGTSYKTFLSRLIPVTDNAASAMMDLGLSTGKGNSAFFDAQGNFVGMEQAATMLHGATAGLSEEQRLLAFNTIFGSDAIRAAAMIAEAGGEGFAQMGRDMAGAGTAAEQAAQRSQGFNFALDSLMGSVETLAIVAGSALLPMLTALINNGLIPIVNAVTVAAGGLDAFGQAISGLVVPAIAALTAATVAYGISAIAPLLVNIPAMTAVLIYQAGVWAANAAAVALAALPYIAIAAAIGGVVWAYNNFNSKVEEATNLLLESRPWWTESSAAIERYGAATDEARVKLEPYATSMTAIRGAIEEQIDSLARRDAAGMVSNAQYAAEMAGINELREDLTILTGEYGKVEQSLLAQASASMTATNQLIAMEIGTQQMGAQAALTSEELEKLGQAIQENYGKGATAVQSYVATEIEFLGQARAARISGDAETLRSQAARYAQEQAAQAAHLGQMLIDYTIAQQAMGNISSKQAIIITQAIEKQYGIQKDLSGSTYLQLAADIDAFAASGSEDMNALSGQLGATTNDAMTMQVQMDALAKTYEANLVQNFMDGKIDADQLAESLRAIPSKVYSEVITRHIDEYETRGENVAAQGISGYRASGGPVWPGGAFVVGESGKELFLPKEPGTIIPTNMMDAFMAQGGGTSIGDIDAQLETFGKIADLISAGTDAFAKLRGMGDVPQESIINFVSALGSTTNMLAYALNQIGVIAIGHAGIFVQTAKEVVGLIGDGADALTKLRDFEPVADESIRAFVTALTTTVLLLSSAVTSGTVKALAVGVEFAQAAKEIVSVIGDGVDALAQLAGFAAPSTESIWAFTQAVADLTYAFVVMGDKFSADMLGAATIFADGAGAVIAVVGDGVDGLLSLVDFERPAIAAIWSFAQAIADLTYAFIVMGAKFDEEMLSAAASFATSAGQVVGIVAGGVEGLAALTEFERPAIGVIWSFAAAIADLVYVFTMMGAKFSADMLDAAQGFADAASAVVGVIGAGVEGLAALTDFAPPTYMAALVFVGALQTFVTIFASAAQFFQADALVAAALFADAAGAAVGIIGEGVEGLMLLADFEAPTYMASLIFVGAVETFVSILSGIAGFFSAEALGAATTFAEAAGSVVGIIGSGVEGLMLLATFVAPSWDAMQAFRSSLMQWVGAFVQLVFWFEGVSLDAAVTFAEGTVKVLSVLGPGIDGLTKLTEFVAPAWSAMQAFRASLMQWVGAMVQLASWFEGVSLEGAVVFAEAAGTVVGILSSGVTGLSALADLGPVSELAIQNFATAVNDLVIRLAAVALTFSTEAIIQADAFADAAGAAVGILEKGVEGLLKVDTFAGVSEAAIGRFADGVRIAVAAMVRLAAEFGPEAVAAANTFAKAAGESTDFFKKGVDGFVKLEKVTAVPQQSMDIFSQSVILLVNTIIQLSSIITTDVLAEAVRFAVGMDQVIQVMTGALKAISKLGADAASIPAFVAVFAESVAAMAADFAAQVIPPATNIGQNIAIGIANGIWLGAGAIAYALSSVINGALASAKAQLGIASESKVFRDQVGAEVGAGMASGVMRSIPLVTGAIGQMSGAAVGAGGSTTNNAQSITINVYQQPGEDSDALADRIERRLTQAAADRLGG